MIPVMSSSSLLRKPHIARRSEAIVLGRMLDLCPRALKNRFHQWIKIYPEFKKGLDWNIGLEQLEETLELEKQFSEKDKDAEIGIDVSTVIRIGANVGLVTITAWTVAVI
jgi:hypothetical protein